MKYLCTNNRFDLKLNDTYDGNDNIILQLCVTLTQPCLYTGCPTTVSISPSTGPFSAGDVLTCDANGFPEPSYQWTDSSGTVVSSTSTVTLPEGSFSLTCTATGDLAEPCSASDYISGIAKSKYCQLLYQRYRLWQLYQKYQKCQSGQEIFSLLATNVPGKILLQVHESVDFLQHDPSWTSTGNQKLFQHRKEGFQNFIRLAISFSLGTSGLLNSFNSTLQQFFPPANGIFCISKLSLSDIRAFSAGLAVMLDQLSI